MASKDLEKLREKFAKDPNSKLFLPLAEEYRKEGMLDEAIDVLQQGIEKHSTYTSARVLLGKMYLEKGMMDEARREFESVIRIVPDNLFAHKKLAELYRDTGETDLAIKAFRAILKLNPMDDESVSNLRDIEAALSAAAPAEEDQKAGSEYGQIRMPEAAAPDPGEPADIHNPNDATNNEAFDIEVDNSVDELNSFKESLFGDKPGMADEPVHDNDIHVDTAEDSEKIGEIFISDDDLAVAEDLSLEDIDQDLARRLTADVSDPLAAAQDTEGPVDPEEETEGPAEELVDLAEEMEVSAEGPLDLEEETEGPAEETLDFEDYEEAVIDMKAETADLSEADRFVAEGRFAEAMGVYRRFLDRAPNDKRVLQRVEELRALLKLMGRDKELLIAKLNAFLEGIKKGRNGFLGLS